MLRWVTEQQIKTSQTNRAGVQAELCPDALPGTELRAPLVQLHFPGESASCGTGAVLEPGPWLFLYSVAFSERNRHPLSISDTFPLLHGAPFAPAGVPQSWCSCCVLAFREALKLREFHSGCDSEVNAVNIPFPM